MVFHASLRLVEPDQQYAGAFLEMAEEFQAAGEFRYEKELPLLRENFTAFVERLREYARGAGLPPGYIPASEFWLIDDRKGKIQGAIRLRHHLTPYLLERGGHIGYAVRPDARRKGYGKQMLAILLGWLRDPLWQQARGLDLPQVLVTCAVDNIGSARIIEANGGVLENQVWSEGELIARYWIDLDLAKPTHGNR